MRVFVLGTGRCGSTTFSRACMHMNNYSVGHESLADRFGNDRFAYTNNHIECDTRLSWHLGQLEKIFGDTAYYVHLKRDKEKVAQSHLARIYTPYSIAGIFCGGIRMSPPEWMNRSQRLQACYDYIDTINSNIELFLCDKTNKMTIQLEQADGQFQAFWSAIGANGNIEAGLAEFDQNYNASDQSLFKKLDPFYDMKLMVLRTWRRTMSVL